MYKGAMLLRVLDSDEFRDIEIGEGEMYLVPGACMFCASPGVLYAAIVAPVLIICVPRGGGREPISHILG